ncbi:MAG: hypothetical protein RIB60_08990 [Phycisphaerales bacterium]
MKRTRAVIIAVVAVGVGGVLWYIADHSYLAPARNLREDIASIQRRQAEAQRLLDGRVAWAERRDALGATMISGAPDEFEHSLRSGLAAVAESAGLGSVSSGNGRPVAMASPVARRAGRSLRALLRAEPDFAVTHAWLAGTGDLGQVLTALATLEAQPWVHRVEGFSIKPTNKARDRFDLRVDLASIRMDGVPRTNAGLPELAPLDEARRERLALVLAANPFGTRVARAEAPAPDPAPAGPPYGDWRVTGIIEGERVEALLVNHQSGERRVVTPGGRVLDATFKSGAGESAVFMIDGSPHVIRVGDTLDKRRPVPAEERDQAAQARAEEATQ